jgi:hypothetical protein
VVQLATGSPVAAKALRRIAESYAIENRFQVSRGTGAESLLLAKIPIGSNPPHL